MNHERSELQAWAAETGFREEGVEKIVRLGELLSEIAAHSFLGPRLALKGGTALNLGQAEPPRLSVDLDFNYVGSSGREAMLAERPEVEAQIVRLARSLRYRAQVSAESHAGRKYYLDHRNAFGSPDRIEVDLNFLFRTPLQGVVELTLWQPGDLPRPRARAVSMHEIAAGKLCALLARSAPRDLFDAARLPGVLGPAWAGAEFRRLFVVMAGVLEHPLHSYGRDQLERATPDRIASQLGPMLRGSAVPRAQELVDAAWSAAEPFTRLDDAEREYTDRLQIGEFRPELLFPSDAVMRDCVANHPALLWKARNAREHHSRARPAN